MVAIAPKLLARVIEALGTEEKARTWLTRSHPHRFGGRAPVEVCDTTEGLQAVLDTLGRIEHGVFG